MALPVEILLGLYLGLLTGIVPAFVAGSLGFLVRYFTGVTLPGFGVVVLALSIASIQGGLLGLVEPTIAQSPRLLVAVLVVLMLALYAHNQGDKLGAELPHRLSLTAIRQRTLSADVVELVGSMGQVTVRPTGEVRDMEGYPPLSSELRNTLKDGSWRLPADLPLSELEARLEERLRTDHDLTDVDVTIDERASATIAAAPPTGILSQRVPERTHAVSLTTLVPTGLARGDAVAIRTAGRSITGTVLSARSESDGDGNETVAPAVAPEPTAADGGETDPVVPAAKPSRTTAGGPGRVTVAVPRWDVKSLLEADRPRLIVRSRGTSREFEAFALVKQAGYVIRRLTVGSAEPVDETVAADVTILATRHQTSETGSRRHGWVFAPDIERRLEPGDEVFVAGPEESVETFAGEIAQ
ncbi:TrkA C-terminal domain-containing protein [Halopiger djelfimassiliensis]|uniref:TrkA C-terminal domain-containing protein n=1 Tax=Halopiger djelfimassiliensis TaxID=1293047 RepID=UPI000677B661|nr:TrkA C-terminal domain-containing protein [Halopiger djelfimassiliensis]